jgi:hypothetical protein
MTAFVEDTENASITLTDSIASAAVEPSYGLGSACTQTLSTLDINFSGTPPTIGIASVQALARPAAPRAPFSSGVRQHAFVTSTSSTKMHRPAKSKTLI